MLPFPLDPNAQEIVEAELAELAAETSWLLEREFALLQQALLLELRQALVATEAQSESAGETLVLTTPNSEELKGFVKLCNGALTKGDITAMLVQHERGKPMRTSLNLHHPYMLPQLSTLVDEVNQLLGDLETMAQPCSVQQGREQIQQALKQLDTLLKLLQPQDIHIFPRQLSDHKTFDPPMPEDIVMDFHLENTELVATVRALRFHSTPPTRYRSLIYGWVEPPKVYLYRGRLVEVIGCIKVHSPIPSVAKLSQSLQQSRALLAAYRDKLLAVGDALLM